MSDATNLFHARAELQNRVFITGDSAVKHMREVFASCEETCSRTVHNRITMGKEKAVKEESRERQRKIIAFQWMGKPQSMLDLHNGPSQHELYRKGYGVSYEGFAQYVTDKLIMKYIPADEVPWWKRMFRIGSTACR